MRTRLGVVALGLVLAAPAWAQTPPQAPPSSSDVAFDAAYNAGQDAFNLGKYDEAEAQFGKARDLAPTKPGPWRWLGRTYRAEQKWADCVAASTQAIRLNPTSPQAPEVKKDVDECRSQLGRPAYEGTIPEGQGALAVIANVEGAAVQVDGIKRGATPVSPFPLTPGSHTVHLERRGYLAIDATVDVVAGIVVDAEVELKADPSATIEDRMNQQATPDEIKVGWILVASSSAGTPTTVTIDGKPINPGVDGSYELSPGIHTVEVKARGFEPKQERVVVVRGQKRTVAVKLEKTADLHRTRRWAYVSFGAAAALGTAGVIFGLLENSTYEEARDAAELERQRPVGAMPPPGSPEAKVWTRQEIADLKTKGETYGLVSDVGYGLALASLGVSVYFLLHDRAGEHHGGDAPVAVVPHVSPDGIDGAQVVYRAEVSW